VFRLAARTRQDIFLIRLFQRTFFSQSSPEIKSKERANSNKSADRKKWRGIGCWNRMDQAEGVNMAGQAGQKGAYRPKVGKTL